MKITSRFGLVFFIITFCIVQGYTQYNRYFYDYASSENISELNFDTPADIKFVEWESNSFLFEYFVSIANIPRNTFNSLLKTDRYILQKSLNQETLNVFIDKSAFRTFVSSSGQVEENITLTIYYPKEFRPDGQSLQRK
jgi:hypothetical protein